MKRFTELLLAPRLSILLRGACLCTSISLIFMVLIVLVPIPLLLVLGMGIAHVFGILGVALFGIAVLKEALPERSSDETGRPPARTLSGNDTES